MSKESIKLPDGQKPPKGGGWTAVRGVTDSKGHKVVWERNRPDGHSGKKKGRKT